MTVQNILLKKDFLRRWYCTC